jgi:superfamily II DNA helicase RecQ
MPIKRATLTSLQPPAQLLLYLPEHRVLTCQSPSCQYALRPGGVYAHLSTIHKAPAKECRTYQEHVANFDVFGPDDVSTPLSSDPPIKGLRLHEGQVCQRCGYITTSVEKMKLHANQKHRWIKKQGPLWDIKPVQTFFINNKTCYFIVTVHTEEQRQTTPTNDVDLMIKALLEEQEQKERNEDKERGKVAEDQLKSDNTPWVRRNGWLRKFAGKNILTIAEFSHKPTKDEGTLREICKSVDRVLGGCKKSIADCREDGWDLLLSWLNSSKKNDYSPEPFSTYYEKSTHNTYVDHWKRFYCYCLRIIDREDRHGAEFTYAQLQGLQELRAAVELDGEDDDAIDARVLDLSALFIKHSDYDGKRSILLHFAAVMGIDATKNTYKLPNQYGSIVAGLIYCVRLLLFEHTLPAASRKELTDPLWELQRVRKKWLVDGEPSPFHTMNNLLAYCRGVGYDEGAVPRVQWSADNQTMYYHGKPLAIEKLRDFVTGLIDSAEDLLCKELLFQADNFKVQGIDLNSMTDDMNESQEGYSFLSEKSNGLQGGQARMMARLKASSAWKNMAKVETGGIRFKPKAVAEYKRKVEQLMEQLLILIHITGGQPARGTEITILRYLNAQQNMRNVYIQDGRVIVVTRYHKAQVSTGQLRVIPRFLPTRVGQLLVAYLADILPFVQLLDSSTAGSKIPRGFLWADDKGVWDTARMTKALTRESATRMRHRITVQDYRHIAIAIDRVHVRGLTGDMEPQEDDPHDAMANHGSVIAGQAYGIDRAMLRGLNTRSIAAFRGVADRWHQFLRLNSWRRLDGRKRQADDSPTDATPGMKRRRVEQQAGTPDFERTLQEAMDTFIGPGATFRSPQQREGLLAVLQGESPLVVILPTGGGKSLLFMLPATLPDAKSTVVVVPFVALTEDLMQKCEDAGIDCIEWKENRPGKASIIFVAAETAAKKTFLDYACNLRLLGQLDRIFVDECHLILTAADYRELLPRLEQLRLIPCPLIMLTATLPPYMEEDFSEVMILQGQCQGDASPTFPTYIRAPTHRPNFAYAVETVLASQQEDRACQLLEEAQRTLQEHERAVLFCVSRHTCERMALRLGCSPYHSTWEDKAESLATWVSGNQRIIVATSALGSGIDVAGIRTVVHLGRPQTIIDFVQEAGRGGRQGERVQSTMVLSRTEFNSLQASPGKKWDPSQEAMRRYIVTAGCRRLILSGTLDLEAKSCGELKAEPCDNCSAHMTETASTGDSEGQTDGEPPVALQSRFKDESYYAKGIELRGAKVKAEAQSMQRVEEALRDMADQCPACWLMDPHEDHPHAVEGCMELTNLLGSSYRDVRRKIRYARNSCCFGCSLPGDWCQPYQDRRKCAGPDLAFPLALTAWLWTETRDVVHSAARHEFEVIDEYVEWLSRPRRMYGTRSTNVMAIVEALVESGKL